MTGDTQREKFRHQCEVREILRMSEPKKFMALVEKHRGREAAEKLWGVVLEQYKRGNRGDAGDWR